MPLLEEMDYLPTERFAKGDEILAYMQNIGKKFGLYEKSIFRAEVSECKWDKTQNVWIVSTKQGDTIQTKYVLFPGGLLDKPRFPKIPGIESFKGHSFHTSRWDYEYTGGSLHGGLDGLKGKTVGIIGTGATGVQVIPHLANDSKQLYVFQRTPSTIDERANGPTDQEWAKTLTPGWQYRRRANFDNIFSGLAEGESAFDDKWTAFALRFSRTMSKNSVTSEADMLAVDDEKMEELRSRIDNLVHNKKTAEKLKPWYKYRCKRPWRVLQFAPELKYMSNMLCSFHDQYLAAFNRPSVTLIDTNGAGIQAITEHGVVSGGKEYKLDCLIYATGFQLTTNWTSPKNLQVIGQNSQRLAEKWGEGTRTLHSLMTNEFPNVFFLQVAQAGFSPNFTHLLDEQAQHVAWIIRTCEDRKLATIQPTRKAEDDYVHMIEETGNMSQKYAADCTPGHYTNEGNKLDLKFIRGRPYSHGGRSFFQLLKEWRDKGDLTGMETTEATA